MSRGRSDPGVFPASETADGERPKSAEQPARKLSPRIAIGTGLDDEGGLYTVRADGTDLSKISRRLDQAHDPAWSPDRRWIAFNGAADVDDQSGSGIYRIGPDGSDQTLLTRDGFNPDWAPDSSRIAFVLNDGRQTDIGVMRADGSDVVKVTSSPTSEGGPRWSPRGDLIAFIGGDSSLFAVRPDGTGLRRLSPLGRVVLAYADWSPDGRSLAFVARETMLADMSLYVVDVDGGEPRRIGPAASTSGRDVAWSPDGRWIAHVGTDLRIWTVGFDGLNARAITPRDDPGGGGILMAPSWSPDGDAVAYIRFGEDRDVWVQPMSGDPPRLVAATTQPSSSIDFEPPD